SSSLFSFIIHEFLENKVSTLFIQHHNFTDKDVAKAAKEANDFFVCGWSIVVRKMFVSMRKEGDQN
uniref:hypothetical protein n=1 Tax=Faecalicatena contorta TaxID=39482 RepID=UPI00359C70D5